MRLLLVRFLISLAGPAAALISIAGPAAAEPRSPVELLGAVGLDGEIAPGRVISHVYNCQDQAFVFRVTGPGNAEVAALLLGPPGQLPESTPSFSARGEGDTAVLAALLALIQSNDDGAWKLRPSSGDVTARCLSEARGGDASAGPETPPEEPSWPLWLMLLWLPLALAGAFLGPRAGPGDGLPSTELIFAALAVFAVAGALRLTDLGAHPFSNDEASGLEEALGIEPIHLGGESRFNPPLPRVLQRELGTRVGLNHRALRWPSAVFGALSAALVLLWMRRRYGLVAALLAGLTLAVNPVHVALSRTTRGYALAVFAVIGAAWAAERLRDGGRPETRIALAFFAGIALLSHYLTAVPLLVLFLPLLLDAKERSSAALAGAAAVSVTLPLWPALAAGVDAKKAGTWGEPAAQLAGDLPTLLAGPLSSVAAIAIVAAVIAGAAAIRKPGPLLRLGLAVALTALLLIWLPGRSRYFVFALPFFIEAVAAVSAEPRGRILGLLCPLVGLLSVAPLRAPDCGKPALCASRLDRAAIDAARAELEAGRPLIVHPKPLVPVLTAELWGTPLGALGAPARGPGGLHFFERDGARIYVASDPSSLDRVVDVAHATPGGAAFVNTRLIPERPPHLDDCCESLPRTWSGSLELMRCGTCKSPVQ